MKYKVMDINGDMHTIEPVNDNVKSGKTIGDKLVLGDIFNDFGLLRKKGEVKDVDPIILGKIEPTTEPVEVIMTMRDKL